MPSKKAKSAPDSFVMSGSSPTPLLVNIPQAAILLGATIWAVRQLIIDKKLRPVRIGKRFLLEPAALQAFIQKLKSDKYDVPNYSEKQSRASQGLKSVGRAS
jgi:excisionase family DNA binding protein